MEDERDRECGSDCDRERACLIGEAEVGIGGDGEMDGWGTSFFGEEEAEGTGGEGEREKERGEGDEIGGWEGRVLSAITSVCSCSRTRIRSCVFRASSCASRTAICVCATDACDSTRVCADSASLRAHGAHGPA